MQSNKPPQFDWRNAQWRARPLKKNNEKMENKFPIYPNPRFIAKNEKTLNMRIRSRLATPHCLVYYAMRCDTMRCLRSSVPQSFIILCYFFLFEYSLFARFGRCVSRPRSLLLPFNACHTESDEMPETLGLLGIFRWWYFFLFLVISMFFHPRCSRSHFLIRS